MLSEAPAFQRLTRLVLLRILLELWQRGIHLVPWMRVGGPHIHLRIEPARIIQTRGSDGDKLWHRVGLDHYGHAAFGAEAPPGHATRLTGRGMEARRALQELERLRRHDDER